MTDLKTRFRTLDNLSGPNLWYDIEERAVAMQPTRRRSPWVLIAVTLLLVLAIGGAVLVGSGIVKLPITVDASASPSSAPSSSAQASSAASASPVEVRPAVWIATGNMIGARANHTATLLPNGTVLVAGGGGTGLSAPLATAELYDPATGAWTATGSMNGIRTAHTATLLPDGKVLVAGGADSVGETSVNALATAELYDPATGTWAPTGSMMEARAHQTATLLPDGKVFVAGGSGLHGPQLASAELYDPGTGSWTATGPMVTDRSGHLATLLQDGRVLVLGGSSAPPTPSPTATAELYDPRTGSWTAAESMNGEHIGGTATLLDDGNVLVAGGGCSGCSGGEELYDPRTGSWSATANMLPAPRSGHTATLLGDGRVLVGGDATAELYEPGSGN